nr:exo-alpha-sialidase [Pedobacter panaciterrae]
MKRTILNFAQLAEEMEVLSSKSSNAIKGGLKMEDLKTIVKFMNDNNITSLTNQDLSQQNLSFESLIDYNYSPTVRTFMIAGHSVTVGGHPLTTTAYQENPNPEIKYKISNGVSQISFDNGATWSIALDEVSIVGSSTVPSYPIQSTPVYDYDNDRFLMAVTTFNDYNWDNITANTVYAMGKVAGGFYPKVAEWLTNVALTDQSLVRASANDLLIRAIQYEFSSVSLIPHPSGPTTLSIGDWNGGRAELDTYVKNIMSGIYNDMIQNHVLKFNSTGDKLIIDKDKYFQYKEDGAFDNYLMNNSVHHPIE